MAHSLCPNTIATLKFSFPSQMSQFIWCDSNCCFTQYFSTKNTRNQKTWTTCHLSKKECSCKYIISYLPKLSEESTINNESRKYLLSWRNYYYWFFSTKSNIFETRFRRQETILSVVLPYSSVRFISDIKKNELRNTQNYEICVTLNVVR